MAPSSSFRAPRLLLGSGSRLSKDHKYVDIGCKLLCCRCILCGKTFQDFHQIFKRTRDSKRRRTLSCWEMTLKISNKIRFGLGSPSSGDMKEGWQKEIWREEYRALTKGPGRNKGLKEEGQDACGRKEDPSPLDSTMTCSFSKDLWNT